MNPCPQHEWAIRVKRMMRLPDGRWLWGTPDGSVRMDGDGQVFCWRCGRVADRAEVTA